jgi:hypothetical protein
MQDQYVIIFLFVKCALVAVKMNKNPNVKHKTLFLKVSSDDTVMANN